MAFALSITDVEKIGRVLDELLVQSEATGCVVCDYSGYVLSQQGVDAQDPLLISALGAGVFSASRELAHLLHLGPRAHALLGAADGGRHDGFFHAD